MTSGQTYEGVFLPLLLGVPTQRRPLSEPRILTCRMGRTDLPPGAMERTRCCEPEFVL